MYRNAYMLKRHANERYQKERTGYRWAIKKAIQMFCDCSERGLDVPAQAPNYLRFDDEELQAGYKMALEIWGKWV